MRLGLLITMCFLFSINAFSQRKDFANEIRELFWGSGDEHKDVTEIPEKWKDESAVIIYQQILYQYKQLSKKRFVESESIRRRIKLLDQSAIDDYSEFTISNPYKGQRNGLRKWENSLAELKIIKPDGTEKEVDMSEAVKVDSEGRANVEKIAIAGLEQGDILDFYYYTGNLKGLLTTVSFDPVISTLSSSYPIVEQKMQFEVDNDVFFSAQVFNGAPELKSRVSEDGKYKIYYLIDKDREKQEDIRWYYSRRGEPSVKFQAHLVLKDRYLGRGVNLIGERGKIQKNISEAELVRRFKEAIEIKSISGYMRDIKDKYDDLSDKRKLLRSIYDEERYDRVMQYLEPMTLIREGIKPYIYDVVFNGFPESMTMMKYMARVCESMSLDYEILVVVQRDLGNLEELLLEDEIEYLLKVNLEEPLYLSNWYVFSEFGQIPKYLEGSEALALKVKYGEVTTGKKVTLPVSSHEDNKTLRNLKIDLSDPLADEFKIKRVAEISGHSKDYYQTNILTQLNYLNEDYKYFGKETYIEKSKMRSKEREMVQRKYDEYNNAEKKEQKEMVEAMLKNDVTYDVKEFKDFKVNSTGRLEGKDFVYVEDYTIDKSFLKRAGKNYLIPIGSLIEEQVAIKEDEIERTKHIYMTYARSFDNEITITIPEGFTVEGLDKLNIDVNNSTGGFTSNAELEGQELTLKCKKWYSHLYEPVEKWPELIAFLDAAFQFSQEKVLLKKG